MEQKSYKMEMVEILMKEPNHVRKIANLVGTTHTTASRKMKELAKENVVDSRNVGKNKVFFLKGSLEARNYVKMVESYKLLKTLKRYPSLRSVIDGVQKTKEVNLAVLFGSYAKGLANKNSDIDIFVQGSDKDLKRKIEKIDSRINVKLGSLKEKSLLGEEIKKNYVILKGVEIFHEL